ncbi:MAG: hypothetical protein WBM69_05640 [Desulfobacterales bacterium]
MEIRYEKPGDTAAIRSVHQAAFETGAEADLVDALRDKKAHIMRLLPKFSEKIVEGDKIRSLILKNRERYYQGFIQANGPDQQN